MANISALSPQFNRETSECVCVIETPKNSRRKYKFDEASGLFKLAYVLPEGLNFPFDFGFIPSTLAPIRRRTARRKKTITCWRSKLVAQDMEAFKKKSE